MISKSIMKSLTSLFSKTSVVDNTERTSKVVILTGAGISAPSGIATFRNDPDSFWVEYNPDNVCHARTRKTKEHFDFINTFKRKVSNSKPNAAHDLISNIQRTFGSDRVKLYTTNIDDLHQISGSICTHLHCQVRYIKCDNLKCKFKIDYGLKDLKMSTPCPLGCGINSQLRTDVVLFGEPLGQEYEKIINNIENLKSGDLFLSIGSSFSIFPFDQIVSTSKCRKVNVTLDKDEKISSCFDKVYINNVVDVLKELETEFKNVLN